MASPSGIDAQVISEDEMTFQYQDRLESLPVPDLNQTLSKYLDSVKPHVTADELRQVEFICQQFASGEGKVLQEKLLAMAKDKRNWLERWWQEKVYMECRLPGPLMNMAGPGPYLYDVWKPEAGTLISRTALMLYLTVHFWLLLRREKIRPHKDGKGRPLCMNQFRNLYNTCKIPGVKQDHLEHYFKTESQGPCPSHVAVMCKGHIFSIECLDEAGESLTAPEFESQLQKIYSEASSLPPAHAVSYFTTLERTHWAQVRSRLLACHPDNYQSLQAVQMAMVVIGLDDETPPDVNKLGWDGLMGNPSNKWFDKSMNFVGYQNGTFISNCDHSPMDGMMLVFSTYYVHCKLQECEGKWKGPTGVRKLPDPKLLNFHLDSSLLMSLEEAKKQYANLSARLELTISGFTDFGKSYFKTQRVHPDSCIQLAMQLAYYRKYNKHAPTYETATTRQFHHARTETVRSCTPEACKWCVAMGNGAVSDAERLRLFMAALDKHNKLMAESSNLQGCDRHLFGLAVMAQEEGLPLPQLYQDPAFVKSGGGGYFTLSTSCIGFTTVFGSVAPMCPNGYGLFYCIRDDRVMFSVTAWTEDEDTSSKELTVEIHKAIRDIRQLLDSTKSSVARL